MGPQLMRRYTAVVRWRGGHVEEIDVDARTKEGARKAAKRELAENYKPGWYRITIIGPRVGFYT